MRVQKPTLLDPRDLVFMVAGMLYASGHHPIQLDERSLERAIPAARDLLRAFGITPNDSRLPRLEG